MKALIALLCMGLAGCASQATPFKTGAERLPPPGCIDYRTRDGQC